MKKRLRDILGVPALRDIFSPEIPLEFDCPIYFVRDDFVAREHQGFPLPPGMAELFPAMGVLSSFEVNCEQMGMSR
ncbi:unnamed protein product [Protopolystoma xenopodis]|uniref:Uncharacterized protein n=1 Tax=Protopolystoma xenopodis TaxID=117903 RepID=A0A448WTN2_9PLAT|nr:unnamed protein product [Protopolystoma xenopodis]